MQFLPTDLAKLNTAVELKMTMRNKVGHDVCLMLGRVKEKVVNKKKDGMVVVGSMKMYVQMWNVLYMELYVLIGKGQLSKVKAMTNLDLGVAKLVKDVLELVLEVILGVKDNVLQLQTDNSTFVVAKVMHNPNL